MKSKLLSSVDSTKRCASTALLIAVMSGCQGQTADEQTVLDSTTAGTPLLALRTPADHLVGLLREPMLIQHPSGTLFVSGYGSQSADASNPNQVPPLYRSEDQGETWSPVDIGTAEDGAIGNSDVDLAVGPGGTLYFAAMGFSRTTFRGTHIAMGTSTDVGQTWNWHLLSDTEFDDRPWVVVTPDATAHVVWNDGQGVAYAKSSDRGQSWQEQPRIRDAGGSSHFTSGPNGELALRVSPMAASANKNHPGVDLIMVSVDGGATWQDRPLPGQPTWPTRPEEFALYQRWVEPLAWDSSGSLLHLWAEGSTLFLARSSDQGAQWQRWTVASADEKIYFPFMAAHPTQAGTVAASWFEDQGEALRARFARLTVETASPTTVMVTTTEPLALDLYSSQSNPDGTVARTRTTGGEYFPVAFLADGSIGAVTTLEDRDRAGFTWWRTTDKPTSDLGQD